MNAFITVVEDPEGNVERLALLRGDTVLVAGQGPIGLMFTRLLTLRGICVIAS